MNCLIKKRLPLLLVMSALLTITSLNAAPSDQKQIETVVVRAKRIQEQLESDQSKTPGALSIVDSEKLQEGNVSNLKDVLRYVPGIWVDSATGSDELFLSSRGSNLDSTDYDRNGIKLLQDGLPVTAADGNNHNRIIDPIAARYAVVAPGANGLTYGASTLGGAINFISPTARNSTPFEVSADYGSFGMNTLRATGSAVSDDLDGMVTLETKSLDGYRDHSALDRDSIFANAGVQLSSTVETRFYAMYVHLDQELAGSLTKAQVDEDRDQANPSALNADYQKNLDISRVANKTTWELNENSSLEFGLSYEYQSLFHPIVDKILVDFDGPGPGLPQEVFSLLIDTEHRDTGTMLRYNLNVDDHEITVGMNYGQSTEKGGNYRNDGGKRNGLSEKVDNSANSLEVFAIDTWRLNQQWSLVYGAQMVNANRDLKISDVNNGDVRSPDANYSDINPRIGAIYALSDDIELFTNVSHLYEAPTNFELVDDVRSNEETLEAMHGSVLEIGTRSDMRFGTTSVNWDFSVYYAQIRDEILSVDDPNAPGTSLTTNVDKTIHAGIETLVGASFPVDNADAHRIEPLVSLTINKFNFDSDDTYGNNKLPAAPNYFVHGELMYRNNNGFYVGPTFDFVGKRYVDFYNTYSVSSYELLGLRTGFKQAQWEVYGEIKNALDKNYIATVTVLNIADPDSSVLYPGAPRAAYVGLRFQF